jgi:hypothetical protein
MGVESHSGVSLPIVDLRQAMGWVPGEMPPRLRVGRGRSVKNRATGLRKIARGISCSRWGRAERSTSTTSVTAGFTGSIKLVSRRRAVCVGSNPVVTVNAKDTIYIAVEWVPQLNIVIRFGRGNRRCDWSVSRQKFSKVSVRSFSLRKNSFEKCDGKKAA